MILWICFFGGLCLYSYSRLVGRLNFWKRRNVPFIASSVYSNAIAPFANSVPFVEYYAKIYAQLSGYKYGGCYWQFRPQFIVRDPELIKHILFKDFEYFHDRGSVHYDERDPFTKNLMAARGDVWKALRTHLKPAFANSEMKYMFETVRECAEQYQRALDTSTAAASRSLDFKNISVGYTVKVISSTAFGWKTDSVNDANDAFVKITRRLNYRPLRFRIWHALCSWFPLVKRYTFMNRLPPHVRNFFHDNVRKQIEYRQTTGDHRNDFLQLLMTLNEQHRQRETQQTTRPGDDDYKLDLNNEMMTAQCFLFFIAGHDSSALILSMTLLEAAINEEIQQKLRDEIEEYSVRYDGNVTFDMIKSMPYLQKVVKETLRKYPVVPNISRICTKAYRIPGTNVIIEKGTDVLIPIAGLHRDESFYPDPEKFDPDRFSVEEIQKRHHNVYLPFGAGPRNCIGAQFGLMTVKLAIVYILKKFSLHTTPETVYPVRFKSNQIITECNKPVILTCNPRT